LKSSILYHMKTKLNEGNEIMNAEGRWGVIDEIDGETLHCLDCEGASFQVEANEATSLVV